MTEKQLKEGNILIDDFYNGDYVLKQGNSLIFTNYYASWDLLMPVWHKVRHTIVDLDKSIEYEELKGRYIRAMAYSTLYAAFNEMVNIIKWYNKNKQP